MEVEEFLLEENENDDDEVDTSVFMASNAKMYILNPNSSVHSKKPYYKYLQKN